MWEKHSHKKCVQEALAHAQEICAQRGSKLTLIRKKVLQLVWNSHKPIKAYDLLAQLSSDNFIEKPPTVYRALDFLRENNLIHRIESQNAYIGCNTKHENLDSKFFICDECNEVEELTAPTVNKTIDKVSKEQGFIPNLVNVEVHGICAQCAQA